MEKEKFTKKEKEILRDYKIELNNQKKYAIFQLARSIQQNANLAEDNFEEGKLTSMDDIFRCTSNVLEKDGLIEDFILDALNFPKNEQSREKAKEYIFDYMICKGGLSKEFLLDKIEQLHLESDLKELYK